jgi:transposase
MIEMPHLPDEVRVSLPPEAQAYICAMEALVSKQDTQISAMQAQLQALQAQVTELQARIGQTSQNSSRPPASDPPNAPTRPQRPVSGRKRAGQPGHKRH